MNSFSVVRLISWVRTLILILLGGCWLGLMNSLNSSMNTRIIRLDLCFRWWNISMTTWLLLCLGIWLLMWYITRLLTRMSWFILAKSFLLFCRLQLGRLLRVSLVMLRVMKTICWFMHTTRWMWMVFYYVRTVLVTRINWNVPFWAIWHDLLNHSRRWIDSWR